MFLSQSAIRNQKVKMTITNQIVPQYHKVTHVIFDVDGLLLDTEKIYEKIMEDIAESYGKPYPWEVRMKVLGVSEIRTCEIAVEELELPCTVDEFYEKYKQSCRDNLGTAPKMKGAERIVRHFHKNNIPLCLATSSSVESVDVKSSHYKDLFKLFHHRVCGSSDPEVKEGKPAPDIFLLAAKRFPGCPKPENCLVFEDAPNGVKAARAAGMQVVMVPDPHVTEEERKHATLVLEDLLHFNPVEFGLPPFTDEIVTKSSPD